MRPSAPLTFESPHIYIANVFATTGTINVLPGGGMYLQTTGVCNTAVVNLESGSDIALLNTYLVYGETTMPGAGMSNYEIEDGQYGGVPLNWGDIYATTVTNGLVLNANNRITLIPTFYNNTNNGEPAFRGLVAGGPITTADASGGVGGRLAAIAGGYLEVTSLISFSGETMVIGDANNFNAMLPLIDNANGQRYSNNGFASITQSGIVRLDNASNVINSVQVDAGTLEALANGTLGLGTVNLGAVSGGSAPASLMLPAAVSLSNNITVGAGAGSRTIGVDAAVNGTFNGSVTLSNNVNLSAPAGGQATFNGAITGAGQNVIVNPAGTTGTVVLSNSGNAYGDTYIDTGTLQTTANNALSGGNVTVGTGTTFNLEGTTQSVASVSDPVTGAPGAIIMGNGTLNIAGNGKTFSGPISGRQHGAERHRQRGPDVQRGHHRHDDRHAGRHQQRLADLRGDRLHHCPDRQPQRRRHRFAVRQRLAQRDHR